MPQVDIYKLVESIDSDIEIFKFIYQTEEHFNSLRKISPNAINFYINYYGSVDNALKNIVKQLNKKTNLIEEYVFFPTNNLIFLKANKQKPYYSVQDLQNKFSSRDELILYCCEQVNNLLKEFYPFIITDLHPGNIFVQHDFSWTNIDLDSFFDGTATAGGVEFSDTLQKYIGIYHAIKADHWPNCNNLDEWYQLPEYIKKECRCDFDFDFEKIWSLTETFYRNEYYFLKEKMFNSLKVLIFNNEEVSTEEINKSRILFIKNIDIDNKRVY